MTNMCSSLCKRNSLCKRKYLVNSLWKRISLWKRKYLVHSLWNEKGNYLGYVMLYQMNATHDISAIFVCITRVHMLIFSTSILHSILNIMSDWAFNDAIVGRCDILTAYTTPLLLSLHCSWLYLVLSERDFAKKRLYFSIANTLIGAHFLMAVKPHGWFLSYRWKNECTDTVDIESRMMMFSYVLLICGGFEFYNMVVAFRKRKYDEAKHQGGHYEKRASPWIPFGYFSLHPWIFYILSLLLPLGIMFGLCILFVYLAGGL